MPISSCLLPILAAAARMTPIDLPAFADEAPRVPALAPTAAGFAPPGWKVLQQAQGDLDGDQRPDLAVVLVPAGEPSEVSEADREQLYGNRWLVLALAQPGGGYQRSVVSGEAIMCQTCGGIFGDPFESLAIARGVLVITHYGGSSWRWGYTERFWRREGRWQEIGSTSQAGFNGDGSSFTADINLLTGQVVLTKDRGEDGQVTATTGVERFRELVATPCGAAPRWSGPALALAPGVKLWAAYHGQDLFLRSSAGAVEVRDAGGRAIAPHPVSRDTTRYVLPAAVAEAAPKGGVLRWSVALRGHATSQGATPGAIRFASRSGLPGLEGFSYERSPAAAYPAK